MRRQAQHGTATITTMKISVGFKRRIEPYPISSSLFSAPELQSNEDFFEKKESVRAFRILLLKRVLERGIGLRGQLGEPGECRDDGPLIM